MSLHGNLAWGALGAAIVYQALMIVAVVLKPELDPSWGGVVGLVLMGIVVVGTAGVGVFTTDSVSVPMDHLTMIGTLHVLFGTGQLLVLPWAALVLGIHLSRKNANWIPVRRTVFWSSFLPLASFVVTAVVLLLMEPTDHHAGPDVPIGWQSRALLLSYSVWAALMSWQTLKVDRQRK